jgi:hypothetical protein
VSGGKAIDQIAKRTVREHGDIDVSIRRSEWPRFLAFAETTGRLECFVARDGTLTRATAHLDGYNIWTREPGGRAWRLQVNLEPVVDGEWRYRRAESVTRAFDHIVERVDGIPCARACGELLWKSKAPRPIDEIDCKAVADTLTDDDRHWLSAAIATAHPSSPWRGRFV